MTPNLAKALCDPATLEPEAADAATGGTMVGAGDGDGDVDAAVARLAALPIIKYEQRRRAEAADLGVRAPILDRLVAAERGDASKDGKGGARVHFSKTEPWPEAVDAAELLSRLATTFARHVVLPPGAADAAALWTLFTHAHDCFAISPLLAITSPTPECGKTTLLTVLGALVPKALPTSNVTMAALFRAVERWGPTLLIDEGDTFLRDRDELRGVLNSGHNRGAAFVLRTVGDDHEPRQFRTWAAKAVALIGKLPPALASRAIHMELRRMAPGEKVDPVRSDRLQHLTPMAQQAARWVSDYDNALRAAEPSMPSTLTGRRADNWRGLFAIADLAKGEWPERARRAAEALTVTGAGDTAGIMLLNDIRTIFTARGASRMGSADLAGALSEREDRPWPEWGRTAKPITPRQIARLLAHFGISPGTVRLPGGDTPKGYTREAFVDVWERYLPADPPQRHNPQETEGNGSTRSAALGPVVADRSRPEDTDSVECGGVADGSPPAAQEPWEAEL